LNDQTRTKEVTTNYTGESDTTDLCKKLTRFAYVKHHLSPSLLDLLVWWVRCPEYHPGRQRLLVDRLASSTPRLLFRHGFYVKR